MPIWVLGRRARASTWGSGRLFDNLGPEHIELERTRVLEGDGVTHMHYRVQR